MGGCELRPLGNGNANVSYWTYPAHRKQGIATRAVRLLCQLAFTEFGIVTLEALIDPDNASSMRIVTTNGFVMTGQREGRMLYQRRKPT